MAVPVILVKERNSGVPAKTGGRILITKYGISNSAAFARCDDPCLGHVLTLREDVSDKPQTMSELSGAPSGTTSQTI